MSVNFNVEDFLTITERKLSERDKQCSAWEARALALERRVADLEAELARQNSGAKAVEIFKAKMAERDSASNVFCDDRPVVAQ